MQNVNLEDQRRAGPQHLSAALEGPLAMIREWLDKIVAAENAGLDLRNLKALLVNVLNIVEEDRAIDGAVDELSEAAETYLEARSPKMKASKTALARRQADIDKAYRGLRMALARAKPSPRARMQDLLVTTLATVRLQSRPGLNKTPRSGSEGRCKWGFEHR